MCIIKSYVKTISIFLGNTVSMMKMQIISQLKEAIITDCHFNFQFVDWVVEKVTRLIVVVLWKLEEQKLRSAVAMEHYAMTVYLKLINLQE